MSSVTIAGYDLEATFPGLSIRLLPDYLHRPRLSKEAVSVPGVPGRVYPGILDVADRTIRVSGVISKATAAEVRTILRSLDQIVGTRPVVLQTADMGGLQIIARMEQFDPTPMQPQMLSGGLTFEMVFRAEMPYWESTTGTTVAFNATATAMPAGTAPSPWLIKVNGPATNPLLTYANSAGTTLWTAGLTVTIAGGDFVRIVTDPLTMGIFHSVSGVVTQNDQLLTSGRFPLPLDGEDGVPYLSQWPTLKVTVSAGTPSGEAQYTKRWR